MRKIKKYLCHPVLGILGAAIGQPRLRRAVLPNVLLGGEAVYRAIRSSNLQEAMSASACAESIAQRPIWVLSAGWGSGSTLLQRLIMSSDEAIIWGEPLDQAAPLAHLAAPLATIRPNWPPASHFKASGSPQELANQWVANFVPPLPQLRAAQRDFIMRWFGKSAIQHTSNNNITFGMKEVRLSAYYGAWLKWLFPASSLVFVVRHPHDAWLSCKGSSWFSVWPNHWVNDPVAFAHHWAYLTTSFIDLADELGALMVKYEDLTNGKLDVQTLATHTGVTSINPNLMTQRIGSRRGDKKVSKIERTIFNSICGRGMERLNYPL